ncbi:MAG TPA: glycosyltransferase [Gemmatimonadaceae bacterium]|jgi:Predicted glycosyltransferases
MPSISVCIATHERADLLRGTLEALARQHRLPEEIVVSDSSTSPASAEAVRDFAAGVTAIPIRHVPAERRALPWQRWWAFAHSRGDIVLFLDDDVKLAPDALGVLEEAHLHPRSGSGQRPGGVGFIMTWDDGTQPTRRARTLRERWLGISGVRAARVSPGGLAVSVTGLLAPEPVEVDLLWGGAMSFPRSTLERIGRLDALVRLYEQGIGRGEDAVLSSRAREFGPLYLITQPLALHPRTVSGVPTPYAGRGWLLGLTGTWGRAHTMRWIASDRRAYPAAWVRVASLEIARAWTGLVARPMDRDRWERLSGACVGVYRTVRHWRDIPTSPGALPEPSSAAAPIASGVS